MLTLNFNRAIKRDMADAVAALPPTLKSIDAMGDFDSSAVTFTFNGSPEVRNIREDRSISVDVGLAGATPTVKPAPKPKPTAEQGDKRQTNGKVVGKKAS